MTALLALFLLIAVAGALFFSTLTYSLRDFSRSRLADYLERRKRTRLLESTVANANDLVFITAVMRLMFNLAILLACLRLTESAGRPWQAHYALATILAACVSLFASVAIPHALARHASEAIIGLCAGFLHGLRVAMLPVTKVMHGIDSLVSQVAGKKESDEHIEQEIMSVIEEGEKEGVVDKQEREMIQSVIQFRDTTAGQIMSARPEIIALEMGSSLDEVKRTLEESGHSRVPVYEGTLDTIKGVLYARDLLKHLGLPPGQFDMKSAMRPAIYVPETKPLRDLLQDFRAQKVHLAIVLDEYGGTAGLVTIEDILEELVGEISDEHEPHEPASLKRIDERTVEVDARTYIVDVNRRLGLSLPEDAGFETLGGFVSVQLGRIPPVGTKFEHEQVKYTILDAEPQKVNRVRVELPAKAETAKPA